jgi:hypothetical protein
MIITSMFALVSRCLIGLYGTCADALRRLSLRLVQTFQSEELAQDLFYQYVCDDPISPHAKKAFVNRFPELLASAPQSLASQSPQGGHARPAASPVQPHVPSSPLGPVAETLHHSRRAYPSECTRGEGHGEGYAPRVEPEHLRHHKNLRRWGECLMLAYGLLLVFSLPGSKRRFQERLRRGGGSWRAVMLHLGQHMWWDYMVRLGSYMAETVKFRV